MADSTQVQLAYVPEVTFGVTPNSNLQAIRHRGGSFGQSTSTVRSDEVRSDGQKAGTFRTDVQTSPSLDIELSPQTFDDFIQAALRSTWSTPVNITGTDIAFTASGLSSTTTNLTTNVTVGQWVYVSGAALAANNAWYKVTAVTATSATFNPVPSATAAAGPSITIKASNLRNGVTDRSFTIQRRNLDLTNRFLISRGCRVGKASLNVQPGQIITGSFDFEGQTTTAAAASAGNGTVTAVTTTSVMNAVDNASRLMIGGVLVTTSPCLTQLSFSTDFNPRRQLCIGTLGAVGVAMGALEITGTLEMYLDDTSWTQLQNYMAFTKTSLSIALSLPGGVGYVIEFPNIAFTSESNKLNGNDVDELLSFSFNAEPGTIGSSTSTIQVTRNS